MQNGKMCKSHANAVSPLSCTSSFPRGKDLVRNSVVKIGSCQNLSCAVSVILRREGLKFFKVSVRNVKVQFSLRASVKLL